MISPLRRTLLAVEDNAGDARLLREMLNEQDVNNTTLLYATNMTEAEELLAIHTVDIILLDLGLPDAQGLDAVRRARAAAPRLPLIVLTGLDDEGIAGQALQEGAQDYIIKGQIDTRGLLRALFYAVERKKLEETAQRALEISHLAEHDFLTGLPNRLLLNQRIAHAVALAARHGKKLAVLFLDLDGFKRINDSLGHSMGDMLLKSVAERLVNCVRSTDTVSRQGGDEFVVLLSEIAQAEDAALSAQRILQSVARAHSIDRHDLNITTSIGISIYPDDGHDAEALIKNADTAMYQAKESGRQTFRFFETAMHARAVERQFIEEGLRRALRRQQFLLHYQPKFCLKTGAMTGAEALVRWMHPTRGLIAPGQFISVAEQCGLVVPIGDWVLGEACRQAQRWAAAGLAFGRMAVNVSTMQFRNADFAQVVFDILSESGMDPEFLELELTESVLMTGAESTASALEALRKSGVEVALDDFGTGFSSLSYLQKLPIDCLKIDQSFIRQISTSEGDGALVTGIIQMAHALNLRVVAEGVETEEELEFLKPRGCDEAQGFYFSRPLTSPAFAEFLGQQERAIATPATEQTRLRA
jgi:diguanylate cyclase